MSSALRLLEKHRGRLERAGVLPTDGGASTGVAGCGLSKAQVRQLTRGCRDQGPADGLPRFYTPRKPQPKQDMKNTPPADEWQTVAVRARTGAGVDAYYNHRQGIVALNSTALEKAEDLGLAAAFQPGRRVEVQVNRGRRALRLVPVAIGGLTLGKPGAGKRALHLKSRALAGIFNGPLEFEVALEARAGAKARVLELRATTAAADPAA